MTVIKGARPRGQAAAAETHKLVAENTRSEQRHARGILTAEYRPQSALQATL